MTAALIELGGSHDECLYSQVLFLKESGHTVHLICTANLKEQVADFKGVDGFLFVDAQGTGTMKNMVALMRIRQYILRHNITQLIFNTAEGNLVRNFTLLPLPANIKYAGIIHNSQKLLKSSSQNIISRKVKKYYVLNDYIVPHISGNRKLTVRSFYPIFFPEYKQVPLPKQAGELWICIPGQVDFKRRDYGGLLQALAANKPSSKIKFIVLGRERSEEEQLRPIIEEAGLQEQFILFDSFIPNDVFHSYLAQSDVVLPLLHPNLPKFEQYLKYKITGAYNLAFAYKKPLLCPDLFKTTPDLAENAIFYSMNALAQTINQLPVLLPTIIHRAYKNQKWAFDYQQQKYIALLEK